MERLDRELQQRVWQRVQHREEPAPVPQPEENLKPLILSAQENAAAYRRLSQQVGPKEKSRLMQLYRECVRWVSCMRGLCRMEGQPVAVPRIPAGAEPVPRALEKCYHRERRLWEEWERRSASGPHGPVFGKLAQQARDHCVSVMEILGRMA